MSIQTVDGPGRHLVPAARGRHRCRAHATISVRFSERMDEARRPRGRPRDGGRRRRRRARARGRSRTGAGVRPGGRPSRTARRSSSPWTRRPCRKTGAPVAKVAKGTFTVEAKPRPRPAAKTSGDKAATKPISKPGGRRREGELVARRDVLPAADELHPDRRLGHLDAAPARRPGGRDVAPLALNAGSRRRSRGRTPSCSRPAASAATSSAATPATASARAGYSELPLGREHRLPVRQPVQRRARARTCFFQSEKPYNGGHYRNLMNAALPPGRHRRLGLRRPGPPGGRLLPRPDRSSRAGDGTIGPVTRGARIGQHRARDPQRRASTCPTSSRCSPTCTSCRAPADAGLVCTNVRTMDGKRPVFIDAHRTRRSSSRTPRPVPRDPRRRAAAAHGPAAAGPEVGAAPGGIATPRATRRIATPSTSRTTPDPVVPDGARPRRGRSTSRSTRTSSGASATSDGHAPRSIRAGDAAADDRRVRTRCYTPGRCPRTS